MQNMPIGIFRGDDTDAFSYQTIVGTINTDLDLTGCKAVFRYLGFSMEFDPIPEDKKLTIVIPADETKKFPPGLGYASLRVYDSNGKLKTFSNRIMVFVATKTPMFGSDEFEVDFNVRASLEPLKFFVGPNPDDFDEYRGYLEKVIDRASAAKYGLAILLDAIDSDLGADDGVAATPVAVKAAYAAIIDKLTDDYYTAEQTDEAIDRVAAYYITRNAAGDAFETKAQLDSTTVFYSGGKVRTPTRNDYCVVLADETHDNAEYRYIYAVAEGQTTGRWQPQYPVEGVMTVDQSVTKNSQNPVASSGIWSALWGTASTAFSSLYDWVVAQLAGKASKSDATLTPLGFAEWKLTADHQEVPFDFSEYTDGRWRFVSENPDTLLDVSCEGSENAAYLEWTYNDQIWRASRKALGYQLGSQDDKPLASEAEAEALRTGKADKVTNAIEGNFAALDENGNIVDSKKNNNDFVHTDGNETVAGRKVFTSDIGVAHTGNPEVSVYNQNPNMMGGLSARFGIRSIRKSGSTSQSNKEFKYPAGSGTLALLENIAPEFSTTTAYSVGQFVVYGDPGMLFKCTVDHTGDWTPPHFSAATVEDVLAALRTGKADASDLLAKLDSTSAAPAFSTSSTYAVDKRVTYNGKLYRCTTAVTTAGTWDASKWTEDTMTDPDAVLDITSQNQLRVVAKDGTLLWAQGYDLASTSSATLACDAANNFTFADGATTQAFTLPTAPTGKVGDFGLDIDNSANKRAATISFTNIANNTASVVIPKGENLNDMLAIAAGELARFYITLTTFRVNSLPTWHIVKQVVENGGAQS